MTNKKDETAKRVAASNPNVDAKILRKTLKLVRELRKAGIEQKQYDLAPPFTKLRHRSDPGVTSWK